MENNKRPAKEALNGPASSRQCLHRREGATRDVPIVPEHRVDPAQPSGSSSTLIHHRLPSYLRRLIDNADLIASIDRTNQSLSNCLSLTESALAMIQIRSSSEADLRERLARAEARITCETATTISLAFLNFAFEIFLIIPSFKFLDLTAQLESLRSAADHATGFVNARGAVQAARLHDIPNRVREVVLHGVRHGVAIALATAQVHSGHNLQLLPHGFPDVVPPQGS